MSHTKVLEKLLEYEVPFRQNISVPDPKKARENLVEALRTVKGRSHSILCVTLMATTWSFATATSSRPFASSRRMPKRRSQATSPKYKKLMDAMLSTYNESGQAKASSFRFPQLLRPLSSFTALFARHVES